MKKHNHVTRDIKPLGQCPSCDDYHNRNIPKRSIAEIRDAEAKKHEPHGTVNMFTNAEIQFKAGFDCRDKLDNERLETAEINFAKAHVLRGEAERKLARVDEALKIAVEALEKISEDFGTDYCDGNCTLAKETIEKINKLVDNK